MGLLKFVDKPSSRLIDLDSFLLEFLSDGVTCLFLVLRIDGYESDDLKRFTEFITATNTIRVFLVIDILHVVQHQYVIATEINLCCRRSIDMY